MSKAKTDPSQKWNWKSKKFWTEGHGSFVTAIAAALVIRWGFFEAYVIPSGSMLPTLLIHDHIFVNKFIYGLRVPFSENWLVKFREPSRGEIIVFKHPKEMGTFLIKRVVGVPGDKIFFENGTLYVNDKAMEKVPPPEKSEFLWLRDADFQSGGMSSDALSNYDQYIENLVGIEHSILLRKGERFDTFGPVEVPNDHLFMMGDNRDNSADSRYWGFMPQQNILGRASLVWLSCEEKIPYVGILCLPWTIRWTRFFHGVE
jgi:signal peptidase I